MPKLKITGYTGNFIRNGISCLVTVKAATKEDAVEVLKEAGFSVIDVQAIRPTVMVPIPAAEIDPERKEFVWEAQARFDEPVDATG